MTAARARFWLMPLLLGAAAVCLVVYFDFTSVPALGDDWLYSWDVRHLVQTHNLRLFPEQAPLALVQIVWSAVVTLGSSEPVVLRLSLLPFLLWLAFSTWRLARACGADKFWGGVAVGTVLCSPTVTVLSVGFGSDLVYFALLMATGWQATKWVLHGSDRTLTVALASATALQRQVGIVVAGALVLALLSHRRSRALTGADWLGLGALCAAVTLAAALPMVTALGTPAQRSSTFLSQALTLRPAAQTLLRFAPLLGLMALPFAAAVLGWRPTRSVGPSWVALCLGLAGIATVAASLANPSTIFGGDLWSSSGIGTDPAMYGSKLPLYGRWMDVVAVLAAGSFAVILIGRSRVWKRGVESPPSRLMILFAGAQLIALLGVQSQDRYLAGAVLPLLPVLAAVATESVRLRRVAAVWSGLALVGFLAFLGFGEQDHMAWEAASADVARSLLVTTPGLELRFTYSLEASLVEIPYFDQTGRLPPGAGPDPRIPWALNGPSAPRYALCYALQGDPRTGQDYDSTAPGRIVVSTGGPDGACRKSP